MSIGLVAGITGALAFAAGWTAAAIRGTRRLRDDPPLGEWLDGLYHNRRGWWFRRWTAEWVGPFLTESAARTARTAYENEQRLTH